MSAILIRVQCVKLIWYNVEKARICDRLRHNKLDTNTGDSMTMEKYTKKMPNSQKELYDL